MRARLSSRRHHVAPSSLIRRGVMRRKQPQERRCSYVVALDRERTSPEELRAFSQYLSSLSIADCDVVIVDPSAPLLFEEHRSILRWAGRHVAVPAGHFTSSGGVDLVRAAATLAACEKVIAASDTVRYTAAEVEQLCHLLDEHEVAEPQEYLDPLPWWGVVDAARMLVHRGLDPRSDHAATVAFRRSIVDSMRGLVLTDGDDHVRRLQAVGVEVHAAADVFVRREPARLEPWLTETVRHANDDFAAPVKTAVFFALIPAAVLLAALGGAQLLAAFVAAVSCAAMLLALRGRSGAESFFPRRAVLFAPVWMAERSVGVYRALFRRLGGGPLGQPAVAVSSTRERSARGDRRLVAKMKVREAMT